MKSGVKISTKAHDKQSGPEEKRQIPVQAWASQRAGNENPSDGTKRSFKDLFKSKPVVGRGSALFPSHEPDRPLQFASNKKAPPDTGQRRIQLHPANRDAKVLLQPKSNSQLGRTHRPTIALGQAPLKESITVISRLLSTATQTRNAELTRSAAVPRFVRSPEPKPNPKLAKVWQRLS